jgi:hypothetical protein
MRLLQIEAKRRGGDVQSNKGASKGPLQHPICWRDFQDIPVKWRQLSEPNDQVEMWPKLFWHVASWRQLLNELPRYNGSLDVLPCCIALLDRKSTHFGLWLDRLFGSICLLNTNSDRVSGLIHPSSVGRQDVFVII